MDNSNVISKEINDKLLAALTGVEVKVTREHPTADLQRPYICSKSRHLERSTKEDILAIIKSSGYYACVKECGDDLAINIDLLPDNVIEQIYDLVKCKAEI